MEKPIKLNDDANDVNDDDDGDDNDGEVGGHNSSTPISVNDTAKPDSSSLLYVDPEVYNDAVGAVQQWFRHCHHLHAPSSSSSLSFSCSAS